MYYVLSCMRLSASEAINLTCLQGSRFEFIRKILSAPLLTRSAPARYTFGCLCSGETSFSMALFHKFITSVPCSRSHRDHEGVQTKWSPVIRSYHLVHICVNHSGRCARQCHSEVCVPTAAWGAGGTERSEGRDAASVYSERLQCLPATV